MPTRQIPPAARRAHRRRLAAPTATPIAAPAGLTALALVTVLTFLATPSVVAAPARTAAAPDATARTGERAPSVRWFHEVEPALAEAERSGRLIMVDLYAAWCGWCKKLDVEFNTDHFKRWAQDYVLLRVDVEDRGEGTALQDHLGVRALPTTAMIDHDKVRVGQFAGFKPAPQLTRALDAVVAEYRSTRRRLAEQAESGDRGERLAAGDELRALHAGAAAAEVYRDVLADGSLSAAERARVGAALTDALLMAEDFGGARASLKAARRAVKGAEEEARFRTERLLDTLSLRLTQEMEDCEQVGELETFLAQHPSSTYAGQVRDRLDDLKPGCS